MEDYSIIYQAMGKTKAIKDCIEIVKSHLNDRDIHSILMEMENLLNKAEKEGRI